MLWKGGNESDEQFELCYMEFCIKHVVLLQFEIVYLMMYNKEGVI